MEYLETHNIVTEEAVKELVEICTQYLPAWKKCGLMEIPDTKVWNTGYDAYGRVLKMGPPSMECQISNLPSRIKFVGVLPRREASPDCRYLDW